jgi:hypothetical protein
LLFSRIGGDGSPPRELILSTRMVVRGSGEIPVLAAGGPGPGPTAAATVRAPGGS